MMKAHKVLYFDYFVYLVVLITKYGLNMRDLTKSVDKHLLIDLVSTSNLNKLKLLKLLFLTSTLKVNDSYLLDDMFDNFYAMPYGPVESDVYNGITLLPNFDIGDRCIKVKEEALFDYSLIPDKNKDRINSSLISLYQKNSMLFKMSTFDLVELTHKSESWKIIFNEARNLNRFSMKMPNDIIKKMAIYYN